MILHTLLSSLSAKSPDCASISFPQGPKLTWATRGSWKMCIGRTSSSSRSGPWIFLRFIRSIIALSEKLKSPFMETLLRTCARSYLKSCWVISSLKKMNGRELFMQRGNNHPAGLWCLCCFEFYTHIVLHRRVCTVLQLQGFLYSPFLHWTWISVCLDSGTDV